MAAATYFRYEKVRRTIRSTIVSYLLKVCDFGPLAYVVKIVFYAFLSSFYLVVVFCLYCCQMGIARSAQLCIFVIGRR